MKLPKIRNKVGEVFIDGTPDGKYPLRILKHYRKICDEYWKVEGLKKSSMTIYKEMNKYQKERAKELDWAIKVLEKETK